MRLARLTGGNELAQIEIGHVEVDAAGVVRIPEELPIFVVQRDEEFVSLGQLGNDLVHSAIEVEQIARAAGRVRDVASAS